MKKLTMSNLIEEVNTNLKQAIPESHLNTDLEESMMYSLQAEKEFDLYYYYLH